MLREGLLGNRNYGIVSTIGRLGEVLMFEGNRKSRIRGIGDGLDSYRNRMLQEDGE
jgi:hypothetical protein